MENLFSKFLKSEDWELLLILKILSMAMMDLFQVKKTPELLLKIHIINQNLLLLTHLS